jgi:hypothetical protein
VIYHEEEMNDVARAGVVAITPYLNLPAFLVDRYVEGMEEMTKQANEKQPPKLGEFTKRAAALHEASHCVVARLEAKKLKSASIWPKDGNWFGEFMLAGKPEFFRQAEHEKMLSHLRITLAGRRGELLFEPDFCLRAGLDELVYAQLVIMRAIVGMGLDPAIHYSDVWGTTLVEVDETLRKYEPVVRKIADKLMMMGEVDRWQLAKVLSSVEERTAPPLIRNGAAPRPPIDPLA